MDLGVTGNGVNIALTDTGVDSEHPGLSGKHVAGRMPSVSSTQIRCAYLRAEGNLTGPSTPTMATSMALPAWEWHLGNGNWVSRWEQTGFYGSAPNAALIDVRIGTDVGAGPFENYLLEQEFYESAKNGLQWIIDNKDTPRGGMKPCMELT